MERHQQIQQKQPIEIRSKTSKENRNLLENDNQQKKIDTITSQLLDLCSQRSSIQESINSFRKEHLEIRQKVNELRNIQNSIQFDLCLDDDTEIRSERLKILSKWCLSNGVRNDGVEISAFGDQETNFGIRTIKNFQIGDSAVQVPRHLFLSVENVVKRHDALRIVFESDPMLKGMPNVALSLILAIEKLNGSGSFWYPYIHSLPTIRLTPLYSLVTGNEDLVELLRGSAALEEILKLYKNIVRQYAYFAQMLSSTSSNLSSISSRYMPKDSFTFDLYLWAAITVMTRINFVPSVANDTDGKPTMVPALIPFFDMANHGNVPPCTDFLDNTENERQYAVIYASKPYQPNEEFLIYYGDRKYWEFFVYNGFIYEDGGQFPHVNVKLGISSNDRLFDLRMEALQHYGLQPSEYFRISKYVNNKTGSPIPNSMQQFARIFCANEEELRSFCSTVDEMRESKWSIKMVDEARRFLITRLSLLLRTYSNLIDGNTITTDSASSTATSNRSSLDEQRVKLFLKFVRGETDSLKSAIAFLEQAHE